MNKRVVCLAIRVIVLVLGIIADNIACADDKDGLQLYPL